MTETKIEAVTKRRIFDLIELPDQKSQLIKPESLTIKKDTKFENLLSDFDKLIKLIHLAENEAHVHYNIQIQIRDVGRIITRLANDTSSVINAFEKASTEMTKTWKITYGYLISSFEEEALITLSGIEDIAKEMLDTLEKLRKDNSIAIEKVNDIFNAAKKKKEEDEEKNRNIDIERKEFLIEETKWKKSIESIQADLEDLETKVSTTVKNIEKAENSVHGWGIVGIFFPFSSSTKKMFQISKEKAEIEWEEKKRLFEEQRRQIAARREANEKFAVISLKLRQCEDQSVLAENVINSLDYAFSALSNIEGIIESARMHWEKMYAYCKQLSTQKIGQIMKNNANKCAKCITMFEEVEENNDNLVKYLNEDPSYEQRFAIIKNLAKKPFKNNLSLKKEEVNEQETSLNNDTQKLVLDDA